MGLLGRVIGGALEGAGKGMVVDIQSRRDAALKRLELQQRQELQTQELNARSEQTAAELAARQKMNADDIAGRKQISEDEIAARSADRKAEREDRKEDRRAVREERRGTLKDTYTGKDGKLYGVYADGATKELSAVGAADKTGDDGLTPAQQRVWKIATERHTTGSDAAMNKETNWKAVGAELRKQGHKELASLADPDYRKPLPSNEIMGKGTKEKPFIIGANDPEGQKRIDWFKTKAPAGSVIVVDGKKYTK